MSFCQNQLARLAWSLCTILGFSLCGLPARAATWHVSAEKGKDQQDPNALADSDSRIATEPWQTIRHATRRTRPGDTVILHGGIYRADKFLFGPAGKDAQAMTVFKAAPGERVMLTDDIGDAPGISMYDYVRLEGLWCGGRWTKNPNQPIFGVGGSPLGHGRQLVGCTVFGYTCGILVGSSEHLLIQGCRIVHCGSGKLMHGCYLSGGYTPAR